MTIITIIITVILLIISGVSKVIRDNEVRTNNVAKTANNKYKKDVDGNLIPSIKAPLYYLGLYKPKYVERKPYSSTLLVLFTDKYHFFSFLENTSLFLVFSIQIYGFTLKTLLAVLVCYLIKQLAFNLKYEGY